MIDQLESDVTDALHEHAHTLPPETLRRVLRADYHPHTPARRSLLALGGTAGVLAAGGIAVSVVGLGAGTQRAFAGWTPAPTVPAAGQTGAAEAACQADVPAPGAVRRAEETATGPHRDRERFPPPVEAGNEWHAILTDTRGPYTIVLQVDTNAYRACLTGPPSSTVAGIGGGSGGGSGTRAPAPAAGQIKMLGWGFSRASDEQPFSHATGRVGEGVQALTLVLGDGTRVTASIVGSWFFAWWPGTQKAVTVEVTTAAGTRTQPSAEEEEEEEKRQRTG